MAEHIKVITVDDHPIILRFIQEELGKQADIQLVGVQNHGADLLKLVRAEQPDVIILDLHLGSEHFDPVREIENIKREFPEVQVIILTGEHSEVLMHQLTSAGARGYLLKSDDLSLNLPQAVRAVHAGKRFLSPEVIETLLDVTFGGHEWVQPLSNQEVNILRLLCRGLQNDQIAGELHISAKRVGNVLTGIYAKLDLSDKGNKRLLAAEKARELGYC